MGAWSGTGTRAAFKAGTARLERLYEYIISLLSLFQHVGSIRIRLNGPEFVNASFVGKTP